MKSIQKDVSRERTKAFLQKRQQYNQLIQATMPQSMRQAMKMANDGKPETIPKPQNARQTKNFERKCFYGEMFGHRQKESRMRARGLENGTFETRDRQTNTYERPQFNRKLVCQISGYTGRSAKYCNQRQRNAPPILELGWWALI